MLARKYRLTGTKNFERVKKDGVLYRGELFGLACLKRDDRGPSRFGFVVSKKISKKAVQRNRAKRRLRDAVKQSLKDIPNGFDVLLLAKKPILGKPDEEIRKEMRKLLDKTRLRK